MQSSHVTTVSHRSFFGHCPLQRHEVVVYVVECSYWNDPSFNSQLSFSRLSLSPPVFSSSRLFPSRLYWRRVVASRSTVGRWWSITPLISTLGRKFWNTIKKKFSPILTKKMRFLWLKPYTFQIANIFKTQILFTNLSQCALAKKRHLKFCDHFGFIW